MKDCDALEYVSVECDCCRPEAKCLVCDMCTDCCNCWVCPECDVRYAEDEGNNCGNCNQCENCCTCRYCDGCNNTVYESDWCEKCDRCNECCTCKEEKKKEDKEVESREFGGIDFGKMKEWPNLKWCTIKPHSVGGCPKCGGTQQMICSIFKECAECTRCKPDAKCSECPRIKEYGIPDEQCSACGKLLNDDDPEWGQGQFGQCLTCSNKQQKEEAASKPVDMKKLKPGDVLFSSDKGPV